MLPLSNAHTHTTFCDGKNTVEEMAQAAIARGFVSLGFSIHGWTPYEVTPLSMKKEARYRAEVHRAAEVYRDRLEIICGVERDALYDRPLDGFDYHIDSVHFLPCDGEMISIDYSAERTQGIVDRAFGGNYYAFCREYYRLICAVCEASTADFLGHIDLVSKFNEGGRCFDEADPRYLRPALEAAECAVRRGLPIEINTGAISRGHRTAPYPNPAILRHIHDLGGKIIINSDAHAAEHIDCAFPQAVALAKACGFKTVLRLRSFGFEEIPLD